MARALVELEAASDETLSVDMDCGNCTGSRNDICFIEQQDDCLYWRPVTHPRIEAVK